MSPAFAGGAAFLLEAEATLLSPFRICGLCAVSSGTSEDTPAAKPVFSRSLREICFFTVRLPHMRMFCDPAPQRLERKYAQVFAIGIISRFDWVSIGSGRVGKKEDPGSAGVDRPGVGDTLRTGPKLFVIGANYQFIERAQSMSRKNSR